MKLDSKQLRHIDPVEVEEHARNLKRNPIYFILENIYDTYNIGGIFRLADGLAVEKIYLCGEMDIPPHHKIAKASVGTYKIVPWEYKETAKEAIEELKQKSVTILAVEQSDKSVPFNEVEYTFPIALLVGNETFGVKPETLELVDKIVEIPMWGINKSLNVIVSAAIASYWAVMNGKKVLQ